MAAFVDLARKRWTIENEGFNNLVTNWHADHVYRHEDKASENFLLAHHSRGERLFGFSTSAI